MSPSHIMIWGTVYKCQDKHEEAMRYYRQALRIKQKAFGNVRADVACNKYDIGLILAETGKSSEARAMFVTQFAKAPPGAWFSGPITSPLRSHSVVLSRE